ncbi:MAG: M1 family metallopeptidase [Lysobacterales bacterium]
MSSAVSRPLLICLAVLFTVSGCQDKVEESKNTPVASAANDIDKTEDDIPLGQLPAEVRPVAYQLELTIIPEQETFGGKTTIELDITGSRDHFYLHGKNIEARGVQLTDGVSTFSAVYEQVDPSGVVRISSPRALEGRVKLEIEYSAPFNKALEGLYKVSESGNDYAFTQFEAISARLAFPGFDEPGFKTPFTTTLIVPEGQVAISNTPELSSDVIDGMRVVHFAPTKPLPTYLLAFAVGDFDVMEWSDLPATEVRDHPLPLRGIAVKGKGEQLAYALQGTNAIVTALESYFGTPYPWAKLDIIAVPDFNAGAMENAGAITYREPLLLFDENATPERKRLYKLVQAHELAHQWFGDLVTPAWWNDIWLNESFATWMAHVAMDIAEPDANWRRDLLSRGLAVMADDSLVSARKIRQPILSNNDIASAFDGITYSKGGAVLSMFENFIGREDFRQGVRNYMDEFQYGTATADDFISQLGAASTEQDPGLVITAFNSFLEQAGLPLVEVTSQCRDENLNIQLTQSRYFPLGSKGNPDQQWQIPVCLRLGYTDDDIKTCLVLTDPEQTFQLPQGCPEWIMPNADSAGYYRFNLSREDWTSLLEASGKLNTNEMMAVAGSLAGAFNSGDLDVGTLMSIVPQLIASPGWQVATAPIEQMNFMYEKMASDGQKQALESRFTELYSGKLQATGLETTADLDRARLQNALVGFMAKTAKQPGLRTQLVSMAQAYSGFATDGEIHPDAVNPIIIGTALMVAVDELGNDFVDHLHHLLTTSTDAVVRGRLLDAIGNTKDPEKAAGIRELVFSNELRDNEIYSILFPQARMPETRDATWSWFKQNMDRILVRIPEERWGRMTAMGQAFCSTEKQAEVQDYFTGRIDTLTGGPRSLAQTLEGIDLCMAKVKQHKPEMDAWLGQ